ncbi:hypothetical protein KAF25_006885, partial [Fusarium avenaceum]
AYQQINAFLRLSVFPRPSFSLQTMARRRNRKTRRASKSKPKPRNRLVWSARDRLQLLAYLNWCAQYNSPDFETTAITHLERATGKRFTACQIRAQLEAEWKAGGRCSPFEELFSLGTAGLNALKPHEQKVLEQILVGIDAPHEGPWLRSTSSALAARSRSLSVARSRRSATQKRAPSPRHHNEKPAALGASLPPEGRWLRSTSRSLATRSHTLSTARSVRATTELQTYSPQPRNSNKAKELQNPKHTKRCATRTNKVNTRTGTRKSARLASRDQISEDEPMGGDAPYSIKGETGLSTAASPQSSSIGNFPASVISDSEVENMIGAPETTSEALPDSTAERRLHHAEAEISRQNGYVLTLLNRLSEARKEIQELHRINRAAGPTQVTVTELQEKISRLTDKLVAHDTFLRNLNALQTNSLAFSGKPAREELKLLYNDTNNTSQLICQMGAHGRQVQQSSDIPEHAKSWVELLYDGEFGSLLEYSEVEGIATAKLVSAFLMAGIFKLVMEPVFSSVSAMRSSLLDQYRRHISNQCGSGALRQLDLVAANSLLSNEEVRDEVVSETARWLTTIILPSLNTFLPLESQDMSQRLPLTGIETDVLMYLEETVSRALSIKIEAMPSSRRFRRIFFRSGMKFDADTMRYDESQSSSLSSRGQIVKLCLLPAVFLESAETGDLDHGDDESPLAPIYGDCFTEAAIYEIDSLALVSKAVVLV